MYLTENPVLQRELLMNLRSPRAFLLLLFYLLALGSTVVLAWPRTERLELALETVEAGATAVGNEARSLVDLFFVGQYLLCALLAPSFTAGAITMEKERQTYEMLLASPLKPGAIIVGKLLAALCHLGLLVFASLPVVVLCLPLGGVSLYELLVSYVMLVFSTITFGVISLSASAYFRRTSAALIVSYLLILPLALAGAGLWGMLGQADVSLLLLAGGTLLPAAAVALWSVLLSATARRLLHPPDVGSEGREVIDEDAEQRRAVGLVLERGRFPDNLFAPAERQTLLDDGVNPVLDKEMRSEILGQGTRMLRIVIQVSMLLAIPLMYYCFYANQPQWAAWYVNYVLLFNVLVGPVFAAGSVTSERERQSLDLLLTTTLTSWQILSAKWLAALRVSGVLTLFLVWPLLLAALLVDDYWSNFAAIAAWLAIIALCCVTTSTVALFASVVSRRSSSSLMGTYVVIVVLFMLPLAATYFGERFYAQSAATQLAVGTSFASPFAAALSVPLDVEMRRGELGPWVRYEYYARSWSIVWGYLVFYTGLNAALVGVMHWLFGIRWRVAQ